MKLDMRVQMLVQLAAMIRTNPAIRGSKRLVSDRCTLIVALLSLTLQCHPKKMYPDIGNPFGIKEYNECSATISPVYSMISLQFHTQTLTQVKSDTLRVNILGAT